MDDEEGDERKSSLTQSTVPQSSIGYATSPGHVCAKCQASDTLLQRMAGHHPVAIHYVFFNTEKTFTLHFKLTSC